MSRPSITGATRVVGVLGWPVAHSKSPRMHNAAFAALGLDFCYVALPVALAPAQRVGEAVAGVRALGLAGCNVTTPHKQAVLPYLDVLTDFARVTGAVNTIWRDEHDRLCGDNTDGPGLVQLLRSSGVVLEGARAVILGAGGSARSAVAALAHAGCARVAVLNRTLATAHLLVDALRGESAACALRAGAFPQDIREVAAQADIIVNCTALGMGDAAGQLAWDPAIPLDARQVVCDLVYHPPDTRLLRYARAHGARALDGLAMLAHQGALSFERWTGLRAPLEVMTGGLDRDVREDPEC